MRIAAPWRLRVEQLCAERPLIGLGTGAPRLSWGVPSADAAYVQTAYELEISRGGVPRQFRVESAQQILVPWPDSPLQSREACAIRVRVGCGDQWSDWSQPARVEAGLLQPSDWSAALITPTSIGGPDAAAPILSRQLVLDQSPMCARLYCTAHGVYIARINGERVSEDQLSPGWTSYAHRLRYQAYDVAALLREGHNTIEFTLGNGWFRGYLGYEGLRSIYGNRLGLLAQLEIGFADSSVLRVVSDECWAARDSHILGNDLYNGEIRDLRLEGIEGVSDTVDVLPFDHCQLVAPEAPSVRITGTQPAMQVWRSPAGRTLVDFGQNLVGWVSLRVRGLARGAEVTIRHAEVLENGELGTRPLRRARATDRYLVAGLAEERLEPEFTFHGFRYAEITGVPDLQAADLQAVIVGSALERRGWFESSHTLLNRFHDNIVWSMRGNFLDIPTDCPQRDERLGWTGDIQVFAPTAAFLCDVSGFLSAWLRDLAAEQRADGAVPHYVPCVSDKPAACLPTAAWGDVTTLLPWTLYERYADIELLRRQYPSMRAWVEHVAALAGESRLWRGGFQFGDWLDPTAPPDAPARAAADPDVIATAHFARSAAVLAEAAKVLGMDEDASHYAALAAGVRAAFHRAYVMPDGSILSDAQTVYALAIRWKLLPDPAQHSFAGNRLADLVRRADYRISTGFIGTPIVCEALCETGHADIAGRLLLQTACPSWLYPVTMGATTVWERWDSMLPDGTINPGEMTSFNHYALGAVADWMHRCIAGLAPLEPGYRRWRVQPLALAGLDSAAARHLTPFGEAAVAWRRSGGQFDLEVRVPVGTQAEVRLPGQPPRVVGHGYHQWSLACAPEDDPGNSR